jgi:glycosyltransferase involved in cell wall biosynthesis
MAAYNGADFIGRQIASILDQLALEDELIIVDDASTDETIKIVQSFGDMRIRLHQNIKNLGPTITFDIALSLASGDLVFLSDQDDFWYENKVSTVRRIFESSDLDLIVHDARVTMGDYVINKSLFEMSRNSPNLFRNLITSLHTGCCLVLRRSALKRLLPIPCKNGISHDAWIGVLSSCLWQKKLFLKVPLMDYQRHDKNVSTMHRRSIMKIIPDRLTLIGALMVRLILITLKSRI